MRVWTILAAVFFASTASFSAGPSDIFGSWKTQGGDSLLELFACGQDVCGRVVWLKQPKYIDARDGPLGATKVDRQNPDSRLRNRPILGLEVMRGLAPQGGDRWAGGTCYDPETGNSYRCRMRLTKPGRLEVRGYIGIPLLGRTFLLTR